jgi:predicted transcriptional regulator
MEALWTRGHSAVREIQETFPEKGRPAYTTVQTVVYRLEAKQVIRRVKKRAMRASSRRSSPAMLRTAGSSTSSSASSAAGPSRSWHT